MKQRPIPPENPPGSDEIRAALIARSGPTLDWLFAEVQRLARITVARQSKNPTLDAEDLAEEVLCKLFAGQIRLPATPRISVSAYLNHCCRNIWLKFLEKNARFEFRNLTEAEQQGMSTHHDIEQELRRFQLYREKFEELPDDCQTLLSLRFAGKNMDEIARELNLASAQKAMDKHFACKKDLLERIRRDARFPDLFTTLLFGLSATLANHI